MLVIAGTGKCKTTWVKQVLWPYCKERGLSLYTLANRSMLRDDIQNGTDMPVLTYQKLEQDKYHSAWDADVIVMDECHSLATDIQLDYQRNLMLKLFQSKKTIIIGLTATPVDCVTEMFDSHRVYQLPRDTSQLESVHIYRSVAQTSTILYEEINKGGRILCFVQSSKRGLEIHNAILGTAFVCSRNAKEWNETIELHKKEISRDRHWGPPQVLIATKVMDVGVSIEDPEVTAVIVETDDYTVDLIQMIGRIRCRCGQRIRLYICILPEVYFQEKKTKLEASVRFMEEHQRDPELHAYDRNAFPRLLANGKVNEMYLRYQRQKIRDAEDVLTLGAEAILSRQLCGIRLLEYHEDPTIKPAPHAQAKVIADDLREIVQPLLGKEYPNRHGILQHFNGLLQIGRHCLGLPSTRLTRKSANELLQALDLPYWIDYRQYSKGEKRGKYYCVLVELNTENEHNAAAR